MRQIDLINAQIKRSEIIKILSFRGLSHHLIQVPQLNKIAKAFRTHITLQRVLLSSVLGFGSQLSQAASITDIDALVGQAINTHPLVEAARSDERASAEYVNAAKLNLLPTPILGTSYQNGDGFVSRAGMRQSLWTGGKLTANVNQAIYEDKAANANIMEQQNTVAKNTIDVWQTYLYSMALQGLYVNNIKNLSQFEQMMKRRVEQGVSARIDLDLVTNRILQDQNSYQGAVQQQKIAVARLSQMIGEQISDVGFQYVPLDQMSKYVKSQSADFEQLAFSEASINNPSVIKQQFTTEAAKQKVKADKASLYPSIYAQLEEVYYHKDNKSDGQFSLGVSYDPGAGFSNVATARATEAKVQSYTQNQEASRRTVMENIQTQYQQFISARDQETSLIAAVAGAQIVVDSYRRQFIAGRKTWLEVLNAVREKAGYEQQLLQVQSQMLGAFYKLQVDFGRMPWQQNSSLLTPTAEFHPYLALEDWLKEQADKHNISLNSQNKKDSSATTVVSNEVTENANTDIDSQVTDTATQSTEVQVLDTPTPKAKVVPTENNLVADTTNSQAVPSTEEPQKTDTETEISNINDSSSPVTNTIITAQQQVVETDNSQPMVVQPTPTQPVVVAEQSVLKPIPANSTSIKKLSTTKSKVKLTKSKQALVIDNEMTLNSDKSTLDTTNSVAVDTTINSNNN